MAIDWFVVHMLASFGCLVVLIFCQWEIALRSVALVRMALLFDTSYNNALAYARRRQWAVMSVYAIGYLAPLFVTVLFIGLFLGTAALGQLGPAGRASSIALGFGEGIGFVVCFSFAVLLTAICFIVIACEDLSVPQAVRRAVSLSMRYRWRGASFISLLCISLFSVCMAFYLPVTMIHIWEAYIQAPSGAFEAPFYLLVIDTAEGTVLSVVSVGVALIGTALYYRDMLLRLEGRDIVERLEKFIENDS
ncbi:MAG: hypothetical protein K8F91_21065 [Candidatus Obscuribacterales bacterium]|nr:hypothetical protein [Candidatus Obscuribacterales bacterium]